MYRPKQWDSFPSLSATQIQFRNPIMIDRQRCTTPTRQQPAFRVTILPILLIFACFALSAIQGIAIASSSNTEVSLSVTVNGKGSISSSPEGLTCSGGTCMAKFPKNMKVRLQATPHEGEIFSKWRGACGGHKGCAVKMTRGKTVHAVFTPPPTKRLTIQIKGEGSVTSLPEGMKCSKGTCKAEFLKNTKIQLHAAPHNGQIFAKWQGACGGKKGCTVNLSKSRTVRATFTPPPTSRLTVQVKGGGMVISQPKGIACEEGTCRGTFSKGERVTLTAIPNEGQVFSTWENACRGSKGCTVNLSKNRHVQARFTPPPTSKLTVKVKGGGTVTSQPKGIACEQGICRGLFPKGESVILTATPKDGQIFTTWQGACKGKESCKVHLNKNRYVSAKFAPPPTAKLTVQIKGGGTVTSDPPGLSCEKGTCQVKFRKGTEITLLATPNNDHAFSEWGYACEGKDGCKVTLDKNTKVSAKFSEVKTVPLTVSLTGNGTVTSSPEGLTCSENTCTGQFPIDSKLTLRANPANDYKLSEWGGACSGMDLCMVELKEATKVSATFVNAMTVSLTVALQGEGTVKSMPTGLTCEGNTCTGQFPLNTDVTLEPTPGTNYAFSEWGGSCSGADPCVVNLTAPTDVTALFVEAQTTVLTVTISGNGTVTSAPTGLSCTGSSCTGTFRVGTPINLTAIPDIAQMFSAWGDACTGSGACGFALNRPTTVTATFAPAPPGSSDADSIRFLEQATWGPTPASLAHLKTIGKQAFLAEQFAATPSTYPNPVDGRNSLRDVRDKFFYNAFQGNDQLRQRVAFALGQLFVVSANTVGSDEQMIPYLRLLHSHAFGNFLTLMRDVTLSPTMGRFLDMVNNDKTEPGSGLNPNENYPRELLQLFSVGTITLNPDGSTQNSNQPYDEEVIVNLARVFTGWTYPTRPGNEPRWRNPSHYVGPMVAIESHHDTGEKTLMNGFVIPAGQTAEEDLNAALQHIFTHPNVGPFIATRLIRNLVTSNPSPQYIQRVASVFNSNSSGERGDLQAVVSAILLDPEAAVSSSNGGHLREPVLYGIALLRTLGATVQLENSLYSRVRSMGQDLFSPPSVFNYFSPLYQQPGTNLFAPEFQIHTYSAAFSRANFVDRVARDNLGDGVSVDLSRFEALADNLEQLITAIEQTLLHQPLSSQERQSILTALSATSHSETRARNAVYLIATSSRYQVQH